MSKSKKIQTYISEDVEASLNRIINMIGLQNGKVINQSTYIRELIEDHVKAYQGEQISFIDQHIKELLSEYQKQKTKS